MKERLDVLLVQKGLAESREKAKSLIMAGNVFVNGEVCTMRGKKIYPGDKVEFDSFSFEIVKE